MKGKSVKPWRQSNVKDATRAKQREKNQLTDLVIHGKIITNKIRAKKVSSEMDRLISVAKVDSVANRRYVAKVLRDVDVNEKQDAVQKLFEIAKKNEKRNGGYTKVLNYGFRKGDGSPVAIVTFTEKVKAK